MFPNGQFLCGLKEFTGPTDPEPEFVVDRSHALLS